MKNVAVLGGSFDPPHISHINIAKSTFLSCDINEVWLMPCNNSLWGKQLTDGNHRLKMCELAVNNYKYMKVSHWEIENNLSGKTYDLVSKLIQDFPDNKFSFIIGADNALKFESFYKYKELMELINFIVVPRSGYNVLGTEWFTEAPHKYLNHIIPEDTSSSKFKALLKAEHLEAKKLLDSSVHDYIIQHKIYPTKDTQ